VTAADKQKTNQSVNEPVTSVKKTKKRKSLVDKEVKIYAVVIIRMNEVIKIKTRHAINPHDWNFKTQRMKETIENIETSSAFNKQLDELKKNLETKYNEIVELHPDLSFAGVKQILQEYGKKLEIPFTGHENDFFGYLDEYIETLKGVVNYRTAQKFTTLKNSLIEFGKENEKYQNLSFSMIDHRFKDAYLKYLRNQKPRGRQKTRPEDHQKGILLDTQGKYIESLRTFCSWAEEREYNKNTKYRQFKIFSDAQKKLRKPKTEIITLTLHELTKFYNHDFSDRPSLDRVRDLFCFGAFSGQRWSDIDRFNKKDLVGDVWTFISYKTKKKISLDFVGYMASAKDILIKYNFQLPKISLVKFNLYVKEAARIAGITDETSITRYVGADPIIITQPKYKFIGSHTARKTAVSILLNEFNIAISHVLKITGHSDLKTLQKYLNEDRRSQREFMERTKPVTEIKLKIVS
jgi:integrase